MPRKPPKGKSLAEVNPKLAKEWHPTKNGEITPEDVFSRAGKKVWWKCKKAIDHEWQASIANRSGGKGCPFCSGRKVSLSNCLATVEPDLAKEWHPTKNGNLTPLEVTRSSGKKVWWKCSEGDDHEWVASVNDRTSGQGCPICSGNKVVLSKCLATLRPDLASEWLMTRNQSLTPFDVLPNSNKEVWWKCPEGDDHIWKARISSRQQGNGCPVCSGKVVVMSNCLATVKPDLAKEWHPTKNGNLTPLEVTRSSGKKVWWKCSEGDDHEWVASVGARTSGGGCPVCSNKKVVNSNSLARLNPHLTKEWHWIKNGSLSPDDVTPGSNKKVWWQCLNNENHVWKTSVVKRSSGQDCPLCYERAPKEGESLAESGKAYAKEFHPTKNGDLTPYDVFPSSTKKVWWKCPKGEDHEWLASTSSRASGSGCPVCAGRKVVSSNTLAITNPSLASEWHPTKNEGLTPYQFTEGSSKVVWWKCSEGNDHEWRAQIKSRSSGRGCPVCTNQIVVKSNSLATIYPKLASEWHPTKNKGMTPSEIVAKSGKRVWWKCPKGEDHEWLASPNTRSKGIGCPFCVLTPQSRQELTITFELKQFFNINPRGFKTRIEGKLWTIDTYIDELNLGIEFDGSYWHKEKGELDRLKTRRLNTAGFKIMRVREEPLKPITDIDVVSPKPFNPKFVTDEILTHILEAFQLDSELISRIEDYLKENEIQNEKALDKYIDRILTEKASKRQKRKNGSTK